MTGDNPHGCNVGIWKEAVAQATAFDVEGIVMEKKKIWSANNIWKKEGFQICGLGEKSKIIAKIKYTKKCIRWSLQRIACGYADCDKWNMYRYLQNLIPDMLQDLRNERHGSPGYLGKNDIGRFLGQDN